MEPLSPQTQRTMAQIWTLPNSRTQNPTHVHIFLHLLTIVFPFCLLLRKPTHLNCLVRSEVGDLIRCVLLCQKNEHVHVLSHPNHVHVLSHPNQKAHKHHLRHERHHAEPRRTPRRLPRRTPHLSAAWKSRCAAAARSTDS